MQVAVGFLDLAGIAAACMLWPEDDGDSAAAAAATGRAAKSSEHVSGGSAGGRDKGPLRWVGYDSSPYAVAKSLVVAEMIQQQQQQAAALGAGDTVCLEGIDLIIQVWYSSAWTRAALAAFRAALTALLSSRAGRAAAAATAAGAAGGNGFGGGSGSSSVGGGLTPAVVDLLRHWQLRDVSLRQARSEWLGSLSRSESYIGNFKEKVRCCCVCG